jgi:4-amino-4-deoxy-L-arabinose transferase-like glycosyltransferase
MSILIDFLKKHETKLQIVLVLVAAAFLSFQITRPLVDYDEATYAKVIVDTFKSGDISSFTLSGHNWFEKPPLYLWLAMGSVKIFGATEFAFRLPTILLSLLCLWLVYLIVKELTQSQLTASFTFLILLFSPPFYVFAREVRLDSGVVMAMLAVLLFLIKGWQKEKYLFWIFPALAVGFLFKSFIVVLILPVLVIYSLFYWQWAWLKSKYLWQGLLLFLVILLPWHIAESIRFGSSFWNDYFGRQVFQRSVATITGSNNYYDYARILWLYYNSWLWTIVAILVLFGTLAFSKLRSKVHWKYLCAPFISALFILIFFTLLRTHLSTYIFPIFPFLAMFISLSFHYISLTFTKHSYVFTIILLLLVIIGGFQIFAAIPAVVSPYHYEEKKIGQLYNEKNDGAPMYSLDWPILETLNYYGATRVQYFNPISVQGKTLKAPFYLVTNTLAETYFYNTNGTPVGGYQNLKILNQGHFLVLMYSGQDLQMPIFSSH